MQSGIICINGDLGSGKSEVSRRISELLHAEYVSTGSLQRVIAKQLGLTTLQLNKLAETDSSIDARLDNVFVGFEENVSKAVIDSRMAWQRLPYSLKVRLICHPISAARRVLSDKRRTAESYQKLEDAAFMLRERQELETRRYKLRYGVNISDPGHYDILIKTDTLTVEEISYEIIAHLNSRQSPTPLIISHPLDIFPTEPPPSQQSQTGSINVVLCGGNLFALTGHHELLNALQSQKQVLYSQLAYPIDTSQYIEACESAKNRLTAGLVDSWEKVASVHFPPSIWDASSNN